MPDFQAFVERTYRFKWMQTVKFAVVVLLICLAIIIPGLTIFHYSIEKRQAFRDAKNVVRNVNMLMIMYGETEGFLSNARACGLTESAEEQVMSYSGVDGKFALESWNKDENCVSNLTYYSGNFYIEYTYSEDSGEEYRIYWKLQAYTKE